MGKKKNQKTSPKSPQAKPVNLTKIHRDLAQLLAIASVYGAKWSIDDWYKIQLHPAKYAKTDNAAIERNILAVYQHLLSRLPDTPAVRTYLEGAKISRGNLDIPRALLYETMLEQPFAGVRLVEMASAATETLVGNEYRKNKLKRLNVIFDRAPELNHGRHFPAITYPGFRNNDVCSKVLLDDICTLLIAAYLQDDTKELNKLGIGEKKRFDYSKIPTGLAKEVLSPLIDQKIIRECKDMALDFTGEIFRLVLDKAGDALEEFIHNNPTPASSDDCLFSFTAGRGVVHVLDQMKENEYSSKFLSVFDDVMQDVHENAYSTEADVRELLGEGHDFNKIVAGFFFLTGENPWWGKAAVPRIAIDIASGFLRSHILRATPANKELIGTNYNDPDWVMAQRINKKTKAVCDHILDILYRPNDLSVVRASNTDSYITNAQLLGFSGLSILSPAKTLKAREKVEEELEFWLRNIGFANDAELGALTALKVLMSSNTFNAEEADFAQLSAGMEDEIDSLTEELQEQRVKYGRLEREISRTSGGQSGAVQRLLHDKDDQIARLTRQLEEVERAKAETQKQMDRLLNSLEDLDDEDEEENSEIQFPCDVSSKNIYMFGGFDVFVRNLSEKLPGIHTCSGERRVTESNIRNAKLVAIQINCISHPTFYRISSLCDNAGIPWIAIRNGGVDMAARQIMGEVQKLGI